MRPWVIGSLFLLWTALTAHQVQVWASDVSLWQQARAVSPDLLRPRMNLAGALLDAGDQALAAREIDATIEALHTSRWIPYTPLVAPLIRRQILRIELSQPSCAHHAWQDFC